MHGRSNDEIFEELIKIACPLPCVGFINDSGWHRVCIDNAAQAMRILMPYNSVDKWLNNKIKEMT